MTQPRPPRPGEPDAPPTDDAAADPEVDRNAMLRSWVSGDVQVGDRAPVVRPSKLARAGAGERVSSGPVSTPADDVIGDPPPRRPLFPASFLVVAAAGVAFLALEPTVELRYTLFGPSTPIELGEPGAYRLEAATDGAYVGLRGFVTERRATYSRWGTEYELRALAGAPVLVRRAKSPASAPHAAERVELAGRILRLEEQPASFLERLVRAGARYTSARLQFAAFGDMPAAGPAWVLLDGEIPRREPSVIALPLLGWATAALLLLAAWRSHRARLARERWYHATIHDHHDDD